MKNIIGRTLFWFVDGDEQLLGLNEKYFSLGNLLNRLLSEKYDKKNIRFINIYFRTEKTYQMFPLAKKHDLHFKGGSFRYNDVFDLSFFLKLEERAQKEFIWKRSFEILYESTKSVNNESLMHAAEYAYSRGIAINFNADYRMVEADVIIHGQAFKAAVWVRFLEDGMHAVFTLEKDDSIVFEKAIDRARNGIEFFLEMYKGIESTDNVIVIKGRKDVDYLPLKIVVDKQLLERV